MNGKEKRIKKILDVSDPNVFKPINGKSFEHLKSFDFEIIKSIANDKTDFEFNDFKDLQKTIKSIVKVQNLYEKLEIFKNRLREENIDYKSNFFIRIITN